MFWLHLFDRGLGGFCGVLFRFVRETVAESNMGGGGIAKVE